MEKTSSPVTTVVVSFMKLQTEHAAPTPVSNSVWVSMKGVPAKTNGGNILGSLLMFNTLHLAM